MQTSLIIVDDFLADPHQARREALSLGYDPASRRGNYPGTMSDKPLIVAGLEDAVSRIVGRRLVPAPGTVHGHTRLTLRSDKGVSGVHIDPAAYSGILYLNLPDHCRGGTDFFRHRRTGLDRVPMDPLAIAQAGYGDINQLIDAVVNRDTNKPGCWEKSFTAPMRFNRLILFSPWLFHNAAPGFGDSIDNGRLVQLLFFAAA